MKLRTLLLLFAALLPLSGCNSDNQIDPDVLASLKHPIINGKKVTGNNRMSTVMFYYDLSSLGYGKSEFCTGTLISENYVLTAGHCVGDCGDSDSASLKAYARVGIGQNINSLKATYNITEAYVPSNFVCVTSDQGDTIKHDIAIVKLNKSVPSSVTEPAYLIPEGAGPTAAEIDGSKGSYATLVGYGLTDPYDEEGNTTGVKYETKIQIVAYCSMKSGGVSSYYCSIPEFGHDKGLVIFDGSKTNSCNGDSGGPAFYTVDDVDYVMGVTSYGDEYCSKYAAYTLVDDYRAFIENVVPNLPTPPIIEICNNNMDDNKDGLIDCNDPQCISDITCQPENCSNGVDDNANGKADCEDPECASEILCQPENCSNGVDDNANGSVDCEDTQCYEDAWCQVEHCDNKIDDNRDGLADCDDPTCMFDSACSSAPDPITIVENCANGTDDNGDGLADCDDPQCEEDSACTSQPGPAVDENCTNGQDDNGDGLADCDDPQCSQTDDCTSSSAENEDCSNGIDDNNDGLADCDDPLCMLDQSCTSGGDDPVAATENCTNNVDDNSDGLIDCNDPLCVNDSGCKTKPGGNTETDESSSKEICDNEKDDNNDGLADCDDPTCISSCFSDGVDAATQLASSCSAMPRGSSPAPIGFGFALFGLLGLCVNRRKQ